MIGDIRFMTRRLFSMRAVRALAGLSVFMRAAEADDYRYSPAHRRPVEATLNDLESLSKNRGNTEEMKERCARAIKHLREFADRLHAGGHFDKEKLDEAIADVQHIIDHNRMNQHVREWLIHDVSELRRLRAHYNDQT
jgi:hypothetical protein